MAGAMLVPTNATAQMMAAKAEAKCLLGERVIIYSFSNLVLSNL